MSSKNDKNSINPSKILSRIALDSSLCFYIFLHFADLKELLGTDNVKTYYAISGIIFLVAFVSFYRMKMNKNERIFLGNIFRLTLILNCFNFIFLNIGLGLIQNFTIFPLEYFLIDNEGKKKKIRNILLILSLVFLTLFYPPFIDSMADNYINFSNSIYIIVTITLGVILYRLALAIIDLINNEEEDKIIDEEGKDDKNK